ncbi:uncharacterized protein LOC124157696 [Ischnura elegans]|uniref:uncharacterized protein LOC124157696 n=1 Tax=Ischnura elegans TaxID=197161 RepID=UPI001ED8738F|nr:uncharacterized protein LOC124157696 [Ischnura elegans]
MLNIRRLLAWRALHLVLVLHLLKCSLLAEASLPLSHGGSSSFSTLRKPRLVLRHSSNDVGALLDFFNVDTLGISGNLSDAVICTVKGGHLLEDSDERLSSVSIKSLPKSEEWRATKEMGLGSSFILQTKTIFNISYDVEGNLTCQDTLGVVLPSNTILLRFRNRETLIVKLKGSQHRNDSENYEVLRHVNKLYAKITFSKQEGRLLHLKRFPEPEAVLRVSYLSESGLFDQQKLYTDVNEATRFIVEEEKLQMVYIRSTRYCFPVEEGNFTWPLTPAGTRTLPENPCLDVNDNPHPFRACEGNFFQGVSWDVLPKRPNVCLDNAVRSSRILNLTKKLTKGDLLQKLYGEIAGDTPLSPVEVYFAAETLKNCSEKVILSSQDIATPNVSTVVKVMDAILKTNKSVIKMADNSYGSSKIILQSMLHLIIKAASPLPVPVTGKYFSAFASEAGTGIQGFAYFADKLEDSESKLKTFFRNTTSRVVAEKPSLLAYLMNQTEDYSMISTLFEDDSLFSAAEYPGMKIEGPVFGVKLFKNAGGELKEPQPIPILIRLKKSNKYPLQCVSWEISSMGGWSSSSCIKYFDYNLYYGCLCIAVSSLDTFFTVVRNEFEVQSSASLLRLLPLKSNDGAILTVFGARFGSKIPQADGDINCSLSWRSHNLNASTHLDSSHVPKVKWITTITYRFTQKLTFFRIKSDGEGYLQCRDTLDLGLISNENFLSKPNSASIIFAGNGFSSKMRDIQKFFEENSAEFNFSNIHVGDINGDFTIRITQIMEKKHSDFINSIRDFSSKLALAIKLPFPEIRSNHVCLENVDEGFIWPTIKYNHRATPINPCIDNSHAPFPVRECIGDFISGVRWGESPKRPNPCEQPSTRTQKLQNLTKNETENDVFKEILDSIENVANMTVIETYHLKRALKNLAEEISKPDSEAPKPNLTSVANIVNAFIEAENKMETKTEEIVPGVPDTLLTSIDKLLEKASTPIATPVITTHFSAAAVSPGTQVKGFMSAGYEIVPISENDNIETFQDYTPDVGAVLIQAPEKVGITYSTFKDETLFISANRTEGKPVASKIIGLNAFGHEESLSPTNLMAFIFFSRDPNEMSRDCHFWDVEMSEWSREGCTLVPSCDHPDWAPKDVDACLCTHLTHFAMLVSERDEFLSQDYLLHLITVIGCSISFISLIGIFCIGIIFPRWTHGASKKVQLNLSASLTLLMGVYLIIAFQGNCPYNIESCIIFGALLHYAVLASFSWMLVVGFLQLMRLTRSTALSARTQAGTHLVLRASVLGWGAPALPVAITLIVGTDLYVRRPNSSLCYPTGKSFFAGILFPVAVILTINTIIFLWLIRSLFCSKLQGMRVHEGNQRRRSILRFYAALFLFCLLGMSWVFGLFIELVSLSERAVTFLSYLFSILATLQGTSLFIFFVACERRVGERLSRAATIFKGRGTDIDTKIRYTAKVDTSSSSKTTDSGIYFTSERSKSSRKPSS